jgi:hypothetical protein
MPLREDWERKRGGRRGRTPMAGGAPDAMVPGAKGSFPLGGFPRRVHVRIGSALGPAGRCDRPIRARGRDWVRTRWRGKG